MCMLAVEIEQVTPKKKSEECKKHLVTKNDVISAPSKKKKQKKKQRASLSHWRLSPRSCQGTDTEPKSARKMQVRERNSFLGEKTPPFA